MRMRSRFDKRSRLFALLTLAAAMGCAMVRAQLRAELAIPTPIPRGSTLVIGFLGGFEHWDNEHRSVRKLVLKLRARKGIFAESIANHNQKVALDLIRRALDTNRDGKLDRAELARARVILFGQSWGGAATVSVARELDRIGVPVLLTAQVDSVGLRDQVVPANVRAAVNFYQHDPFTFIGRSEIRAANPSKTAILGNFEETYIGRAADTTDSSESSWVRATFGGSHAKMESDPAIWNSVEKYIDAEISRR